MGRDAFVFAWRDMANLLATAMWAYHSHGDNTAEYLHPTCSWEPNAP
jgi:hypothetical protein